MIQRYMRSPNDKTGHSIHVVRGTDVQTLCRRKVTPKWVEAPEPNRYQQCSTCFHGPQAYR